MNFRPEDLLTPEELDELQPTERPETPLEPADQPSERIPPGFFKKLRRLLFLALRYGKDGTFTPREKAHLKAVGRELFDELFKF